MVLGRGVVAGALDVAADEGPHRVLVETAAGEQPGEQQERGVGGVSERLGAELDPVRLDHPLGHRAHRELS